MASTTRVADAPDTLVMFGSAAPSVDNRARLAALAELRSRMFGQPKLRFGRYEAAETIGQGAFGIVFRAYDPELQRDVAVKVLSRASQVSEPLISEARTVARLNHPNVVSVHDVGDCSLEAIDGGEGDGVFIVMELVTGPAMSAWLQISRTPEEILAVFREAGEGLAAAHAAGVVHRDFKPANVLIDERGTAKVADFGLATELEVGGEETIDDDGNVSAEGYLVGTPLYLAPEVLSGHSATHRSDQYAYCVALRSALSGEPAFDTPTMGGLWAAKQAVPRWSSGSRVPRRLRQIIDRGMAVEPAERWPDMASLLAALDGGGSRRAPWIVAGVGLLALGGATAGVLLAGDDDVEARGAEVAVVKATPSGERAPQEAKAGAAKAEVVEVVEAAQAGAAGPEPGQREARGPTIEDGAAGEDKGAPAEAETGPDHSPPAPRSSGKRSGRRRPAAKGGGSGLPERLSDAAIQRSVARAAGHCSRHGGMSEVSIGIELELTAKGAISSVRVREPYTNGPIGRCVTRALRGLELAPAREGRRYRGTLKLSAVHKPAGDG